MDSINCNNNNNNNNNSDKIYNILITGKNGQLGSELKRIAKEECSGVARFIFTDVDTLNICNRADVVSFFAIHKIDIVINCVAYTAVDKAEDDKDLAFGINKEAVSLLAEICNEYNTFLIHISTDYVYDGNANIPYKEIDKTNPIGVYGHSKLAGENEIKLHNTNAIIIRTAWLYSAFGSNFVKTMQKLSLERESIHVVADQIGSPTWAKDLAKCIFHIIFTTNLELRNGVEIYHFSNEGGCSWFEFAQTIMEFTNSNCIIEPISTNEYPASCERPTYSLLDKTKIKEEFGIKIPHWQDSLKKMLQDNIKQ